MKNALEQDKIKIIRLILAGVVVILICVVLNFQDNDRELSREDVEVLSPDDLLVIKSPILRPANIKKHMFPTMLRYKNNQWMKTYYSTPSSYLMTQLYSELSDRIRGKPKFSSEKFMHYAKSQFDLSGSGLAKERSLYYLEELYNLTNKDYYLSLFLEASEDFANEIKTSSRPLIDNQTLQTDLEPYYLLRMLSFRAAVVSSDNESGYRYATYARHRVFDELSSKDSDIGAQCSIVWASVPILRKDEEFPETVKPLVSQLLDRYLSILNGDITEFRELKTVLTCLHAFTELAPVLDLPMDMIFEKSYRFYILKTFNYPRMSGCPPGGGFMHEPIQNNNCRELEMKLADNIQMNLVLFKLIRQ